MKIPTYSEQCRSLKSNATAKLRAWQRCGATIVYLTSKKTSENIEKVRTALKDGGAPMAELFFRIGGEDYGQVARRIAPDVIVEDDCKSIGGEREMTWPKLQTELRGQGKANSCARVRRYRSPAR
ncbi:MAG: hypothetical protein QXG05_04420 [Nitrososphaerota archaeon]